MQNKGLFSTLTVFILVILLLVAIFALFYYESFVAQAELIVYDEVGNLQEADNMAEHIENSLEGFTTDNLRAAEEETGETGITEPFSGYTVRVLSTQDCVEKFFKVGEWDECENQYSYIVNIFDPNTNKNCPARLVVCIDGVKPPEPPAFCVLGENLVCGDFESCDPNTYNPDDPDSWASDACYCQPGFRTCIENPEGGEMWSDCIGELNPISELCANAIDDDCDGLIDAADPDCITSPDPETICLGERTGGGSGGKSDWVIGGRISYDAEDCRIEEADACSCDHGIYMLAGTKSNNYFEVSTPVIEQEGWYGLAIGYTNGSSNQYTENFQILCEDESGNPITHNFWDEGNGCPSGASGCPKATTKPDPNNTDPLCSNKLEDVKHDGDLIIVNSADEDHIYWSHRFPTIHENFADGSPPPEEPWWRKCYFRGDPARGNKDSFKINHPGCGSCGCGDPGSIRFSGYKILYMGS
ncbi:MAG: hypothetical protein JW772_04855 [Candidatus Diapherotrites archaeon]|nr:hypothetical protein [Candidatus Diapherotrites archaeon]